jgi:hypothetical protein
MLNFFRIILRKTQKNLTVLVLLIVYSYCFSNFFCAFANKPNSQDALNNFAVFEPLKKDDHSGDLGSRSQGIPEPMVFDLVRPLCAKKGELEVNALGRIPIAGRHSKVLWAPEIEYAVVDNVAVELELPFNNLELQDLKGAVQITLPSSTKRYHHGLQVIGEHHLDDRASSITPLYISAINITKRLGVIGINGIKFNDIGRSHEISGVLNGSIFYVASDKWTYGVETNLEISSRNTTLSVFPQVHKELSKNMSVQFSIGIAQLDSNRFRPIAGIRLIRTL